MATRRILDDDEIDLDRDIPLSAAQFPGRPHIATVWRWASKGVTRGGETIKLQTTCCGGRRFTRQRWANDFVAACNVAAGNLGDSRDTEADAVRRAREAGKALEALGC